MKNNYLSSNNFSSKVAWQILEPGQWLNLEDLPSTFAHNQALILCQISTHQWLTWVPDYGEYCLTL